jgi:hypothetical protein
MPESAGSKGNLSKREALALFRLVFGDTAKAEGLALADPWRGMARRLAAAELADRYALWETMTAELQEADRLALVRALGGVGQAIPRPVEPVVEPVVEPTVEPVIEPVVEPTVEPVLLAFPGGDSWPSPLGPAALQGVVGDLVGAIEPNTEADQAAILIQFLVAFGSLIGKGPHVHVDGHDHGTNLFAVVVGETSRARKGTSWRRVREALAECDPAWAADRLLGGLSSGEGLIWAVRDPIYGIEKKNGGETLLDEGVSDKRLLVVENEFGGALRVLGREGNTLSAVLRQAYDGDDMRFLTKNNPAVATAAHVALCGHITREELDRHLSAVEACNGLGNRILWVCARRSKALPFGGKTDAKVMETLAGWLGGLVDDARGAHEITWTSTGAARWDAVYDDLTISRPGLLGAVTSRAEAHALRLAMIYALLDRQREIAADHVDAALAVWRYCADSAAYLFGRSSADAKTDSKSDAKADVVLTTLWRAPEGLTRSQLLRDVFKHNLPAETVTQIMDALVQAGSVRCETITTGGRPSQRYFAVWPVGNVKT